MATVTITLCDEHDPVSGSNVSVTVKSTPGFSIGEDAGQLTNAQALALEMIEAAGPTKTESLEGQTADGENLKLYAPEYQPTE